MTPFGKLLSQLMFDAGVMQKDIVKESGLSPTHISHILNGRKGPPAKEKLEKIISYLHLTEDQANALKTAAVNSVRTLNIPESARPEEYVVVHELFTRLGQMSRGQLVAIREIIRLGNTA